MRFYSKTGQYFWDIDRFQLFTESEKCALLEGIKFQRITWSCIKEAHEKGGIIEMFDNLIKELEEENNDSD